MKKYIIAIIALMSSFFTTADAMSYEQARVQALFLTDKMAYELNLNEAQYEAVYEINLDYLMSVNTCDDVYSRYWTIRNTDLSYILMDWQYTAYCAAHYFYRPIWWDAGYWHFGIYARYPHRDYYFFGRPKFYVTYRGGHSWHSNGGRSWYHGRDFGTRNHGNFSGMRDGWNRGEYRGHGGGSRNYDNGTRGNFGSDRGHRGDRQFGSTRGGSLTDRSASGNFAGRRFGSRNEGVGQNRFGSSRESSTRSTIIRQNNDTYGRGNTTSRSFSGSRSTTTQSRNFGSGNSSTSRSFSGSGNSTSRSHFSGSNSSSSRSFGSSGGFTRGNGGGNNSSRSNGNSNGGGNFGGRR